MPGRCEKDTILGLAHMCGELLKVRYLNMQGRAPLEPTQIN